VCVWAVIVVAVAAVVVVVVVAVVVAVAVAVAVVPVAAVPVVAAAATHLREVLHLVAVHRIDGHAGVAALPQLAVHVCEHVAQVVAPLLGLHALVRRKHRVHEVAALR
jgi:hypothetical protein